MIRRFLVLLLAASASSVHAQSKLPDAKLKADYAVQLGATVSGVYPFKFEPNDALPEGLKLSDTGLLKGQPSQETSSPAVFSVTVTDANGAKSGPFSFSLVVLKDPPPQLVIGTATSAGRGASSGGSANPQPSGGAGATGGGSGSPSGKADTNAKSSSPTENADQAVPATGSSFSITADNPGRIAPGGSIIFTAAAPKGSTLPNLRWGISLVDPSGRTVVAPRLYNITANGPDKAVLTLTPNAAAPVSGRLNVFACETSKLASGSAACTSERASQAMNIKVVDRPPGLIVIPVVGFEQVGASSAAATQKFFFDLFISRPFPLFSLSRFDCANTNNQPSGSRNRDLRSDCTKLQSYDEAMMGPKLRLWGNVRIGSYPQQVTAGVAEFAAGFATRVAQLQVNQLAQGGEFNLGLEYRLARFHRPFSSVESNSNERVSLGWVAGFGGISPFNPVETLQIFQNPVAGSPQAAAFFKQFPTSAGSTFTGFTTPDRERFFWEYGSGIRLTIPFFDRANLQGGSPAMITYLLGQNQQVSGGISRGVVQRVEGFFPLSLGPRFKLGTNTLYLFGRADMRLASPVQPTPFILQPAPATVNGFDPNVNIVSVRSNRDIYTIGVGMDAVQLIKTITGQTTAAKSTTPKTAPPLANPPLNPQPGGKN